MSEHNIIREAKWSNGVEYLRNDYGDDGLVISRAELPGEMAYAQILTDNRVRIAELRVRIVELEAIVAKLPHTADGVPVSPGMIVSAPGGDGLPHRQATVTAVYNIGEERDDGQYWAAVRDYDDNDWIVLAAWCYSTQKAAEEASKA